MLDLFAAPREAVATAFQWGRAERTGPFSPRAHSSDDIRRIFGQRGLDPDRLGVIRCLGCGAMGEAAAALSIFGFGHYDGCEGYDRDLQSLRNRKR